MENGGVGHSGIIDRNYDVHVPVSGKDHNSLMVFMVLVIYDLVFHVGLYGHSLLFMVRNSFSRGFAQGIDICRVGLLDEQADWHTSALSDFVVLRKIDFNSVGFADN